MSEKLREALRERADHLPAYPVYSAALARHRRHRRRQWAALALVVALIGAAVPLLGTRTGTAPAAPAPGAPSLPDRIGTPIWGGPTVSGSPAGAASVVFGARDWWWDSSSDDLALVGAVTDRYRTVHDDHGDHAGEQALLSPDGSRLAMTGRVVDLSSGRAHTLPRLDGLPVTPEAWAPDGRHLAVIAERTDYVDFGDGSSWPTPTRATLYILDLATGRSTRLGALRTPYVYDGLTVAFAPSGDRLAYQSGDTITVAGLTGTVQSRFTVTGATRLAGKGAWTPDGRGLTLVTQRQCCAGDGYPARWLWHVVDPATGAPAPGRQLPELAGLVAVRLLGWAPDGAAVAAASYPEPGAEPVALNTGAPFQLTDHEPIRAVAILAVEPGPAPATPRTLLAARDGVALNIDVADRVISGGARRTGHPPTGPSPYLWIALGVLGFLVLAAAAAVFLVVRAVRRGRRMKSPWPAQPN